VTAIAVVGDLIVDRDVIGHVGRVAADVPVPIVEQPTERMRPGGAGLAASLAAAGADVAFLTAVGNADADRIAVERLRAMGVTVHAARRAAPVPQKIRVRTADHVMLRVDRGVRTSNVGAFPTAGLEALDGRDAILVSDYGGEVARTIDHALLRPRACRPLVWDPHRIGAAPVSGAVVTPNVDEAVAWAGTTVERDAVATAATAAAALAARWRPAAQCITLGRDGALVVEGDHRSLVRAAGAGPVTDACGAGDRFAATLTLALAAGLRVIDAAEIAVEESTAFVREGDDGWTRTAGGWPAPDDTAGVHGRPTVVATSGCFDLLHAGHIRMLTSARALGDRLVVFLNDDASVRRTKGAGRPLVPVAERAELLRALTAVDEVYIFGEDTPVRALREVRPDVFVKGGDYRDIEIPEEEAVAAWGGRVVILPYEAGRSTTELINRSHAAAS
jgi:rfaE bifunctional protein nucleotidyltransferase chain/domain/rfaE bifunctional protein kinase chain/domain